MSLSTLRAHSDRRHGENVIDSVTRRGGARGIIAIYIMLKSGMKGGPLSQSHGNPASKFLCCSC